MQAYRSSAMLKTMAKGQLLGNYPVAAIAFLSVISISITLRLLSLFMTDQSTIWGVIMYYIAAFIVSLLLGVFYAGLSYMALKICCKESVSIQDILYGFQYQPDKIVMVQLVISGIGLVADLPSIIFQFLRTDIENDLYFSLFVVFRIFSVAVTCYVSLILSQAIFLLLDFADRTPRELIRMSRVLMKGHKKRLFLIWLSFLPLFLLGIFTCCIGFLWVLPYMYVTMANFYMDLTQNREQR